VQSWSSDAADKARQCVIEEAFLGEQEVADLPKGHMAHCYRVVAQGGYEQLQLLQRTLTALLLSGRITAQTEAKHWPL
jgi:hypothetical protein